MDADKIKEDFPIFKNNPGLVYLDSTATSQKPYPVIQKVTEVYEHYNANIHRGIYKIAEKATEEHEKAREVAAKFINATSGKEIIFTRNATEGLNLVAYSLGRQIVDEKSEVVTTVMEHHSNFVPWQQLAFANGADFKVIDVTEDGQLALGSTENEMVRSLEAIITRRTRILALTLVSNVLGTVNPVKKITGIVKKINPEIIVVVDAAQAAPHMKVDVQEMGCDLLSFSSHKMLGPTGIGILWGKYEILDRMMPFLYGGEMISRVDIDKSMFKEPPLKFEAGTPNIADAIAFPEAVKYLEKIGMENIAKYEKELFDYTYNLLTDTFGKSIRILGPTPAAAERAAIVAFKFGDYHPHDIGYILDQENIAVRAGSHCAGPLHTRYGLTATTRASFYIYNNKSDADRLVAGLKKVKHMLK